MDIGADIFGALGFTARVFQSAEGCIALTEPSADRLGALYIPWEGRGLRRTGTAIFGCLLDVLDGALSVDSLRVASIRRVAALLGTRVAIITVCSVDAGHTALRLAEADALCAIGRTEASDAGVDGGIADV